MDAENTSTPHSTFGSVKVTVISYKFSCFPFYGVSSENKHILTNIYNRYGRIQNKRYVVPLCGEMIHHFIPCKNLIVLYTQLYTTLHFIYYMIKNKACNDE